MPSLEARRFIVVGRVQGVFFRESTRRHAGQLGVAGHAINLSDGTVEVLAVGDAPAIEALAQWLEQGPPLARVDSVCGTRIELISVEGFNTG